MNVFRNIFVFILLLATYDSTNEEGNPSGQNTLASQNQIVLVDAL